MNKNMHDNQPARSDRLLRADEVAERLSICLSLAYQKMQSGEIRTVRMGRSVRVRLVDLEEYIQRCLSSEQPASPEEPRRYSQNARSGIQSTTNRRTLTAHSTGYAESPFLDSVHRSQGNG